MAGLPDAYALFGLTQTVSVEEIDAAYSRVVRKYPRGALTPELRDAYDAWCILKGNMPDASPRSTRSKSDGSTCTFGVSTIRERCSFQEFNKENDLFLTVTHNVDAEESCPCEELDMGSDSNARKVGSHLRIRNPVSRYLRQSSKGMLASLRRAVLRSPGRAENQERTSQPAWVHALPPFNYETLNTEQHQVRFLRIPEVASDEVPKFELLHQNHRGSEYLALSYVWGNQEPTVPIIVNDKRFMIRPNLADFLWYAQNHLAGNLIWVDAVSIDQGNDAEKNHQVHYMRDIYAGARRVISWISQPVEEQVNGTVRRETVNMIAEAASVSRSSLDLCDKQKIIGIALKQLITNAYWTRIWIVQEIWLAKRVQFLWQGTEVQWSCLQRLVEAARFSLTKESYSSSYGMQNTINAAKYRKDSRGRVEEIDLPWGLAEASWQILFEENLTFEALSPIVSVLEGPRSTFDRALHRRIEKKLPVFSEARRYRMEDLIYEYSSHEATDPRDKIYGLLGLAENGEQFSVDYTERANLLAGRIAAFMNPGKSTSQLTDVIRDIKIYIGPNAFYSDDAGQSLELSDGLPPSGFIASSLKSSLERRSWMDEW